MLISNEAGADVFFDSMDCFSPELSFVENSELGSNKIEYDIWMNEPRSVEERRASFLRMIGLSENSSSYSSIYTRDGNEGTGLVADDCSKLSYNASESQAICTGEIAHDTNIVYEKFTRDDNEECKADLASQPVADEPCACGSVERHSDAEVHEDSRSLYMSKKKWRSLWKQLLNKKQGDMAASALKGPTADAKMTSRIKVKRKKKKLKELTGVYMGQKVKAHEGLIWTMKFSPDGRYLASGGEDGVVRIWRVLSLDASGKFSAAAAFLSNVKEDVLGSLKSKSSHRPILLPKKVFHIEELPIQEFYGHSSGVLDLAWSDSNLILSASKDKTARLWQVGDDQCLNVFHHNDYVTCLQFNPVDSNYFISGSLDGKVRIWGVSEKRVVDWAYIREGITAVSYQLDGNGFMVGSLTGCCRFFDASGQHIQLGAQVYVQGKKKASGNRITGIQFSRKNFQSAIVASEDSKIRVFDGTDVLRKYRGLVKSESQMSASCTSTEKHIISVGEDSHVYLWNVGKSDSSARSCEYFFSEGVTVAIPWSSVSKEWTLHSSEMQPCSIEGTLIRNSETFSLSSWFPIDSSARRGSVTWPEERLPIYDACDHDRQCNRRLLGDSDSDIHRCSSFSETWGLVIVTADFNGCIKTYHNFGLPIHL